MAAIRFSLAAAAFLWLGACEASDEPAEPDRAEARPDGACKERSFEGSAFTVCEYDARKHRIELIVSGRDGQPLRSFERLEAHLGPRASKLLFAMNAGMYDEAGRPIGLYVEKGKPIRPLNLRDGPGNFHVKPNGVFAVDRKGRVSVTPSGRFEEEVPEPLWATQSGPMLVIGGKLHPKFDANGASTYVRNGVGACGPTIAIFAISENPVSFGRFARFFRDALGCPDALFLDGAVSSLWEAGVRQDPYSSLGPMVVVFKP